MCLSRSLCQSTGPNLEVHWNLCVRFGPLSGVSLCVPVGHFWSGGPTAMMSECLFYGSNEWTGPRRRTDGQTEKVICDPQIFKLFLLPRPRPQGPLRQGQRTPG